MSVEITLYGFTHAPASLSITPKPHFDATHAQGVTSYSLK